MLESWTHHAPPHPAAWTTSILALAALLAAAVALRLLAILPSARARRRRSLAKRGRPRDENHARSPPFKLAVFLGSGGHTREVLQLVSALPPQRYTPRVYLVSSGDALSRQKALDHEARMRSAAAAEEEEATRPAADAPAPNAATSADFDVVELRRAREVHQSFLSAPVSVVGSLAACVRAVVVPTVRDFHATATRGTTTGTRGGASGGGGGSARSPRGFADVLVMNGPGTCVPLVASVYILKFLGYPSPRLVYVESFARVRSLSLTARLLRPFVDRFVVQWPPEPPPPRPSPPRPAGAGPAGVEYRGWLV